MYREAQHCPRCGVAVASAEEGTRRRRVCPACEAEQAADSTVQRGNVLVMAAPPIVAALGTFVACLFWFAPLSFAAGLGAVVSGVYALVLGLRGPFDGKAVLTMGSAAIGILWGLGLLALTFLAVT